MLAPGQIPRAPGRRVGCRGHRNCGALLTTPLFTRAAAAAVATIVAALLAGCTDTAAAPTRLLHHSASAALPAAPGGHARPTGDDLGAFRTVDPCALLPVRPAVAVSHGGVADSIMPGDTPSECDLRLRGKSEFDENYRFTVDLGVAMIDHSQGTVHVTPVRVPGLGSVRTVLNDETANDGSCTLMWSLGGHLGISLLINPPDDTGGAKTASTSCAVGVAYLTKVASVWARLPLRSDHMTSPDLPVTQLDPCAVGGHGLVGYHGSGRPQLISPHECWWIDHQSQRWSVKFGLQVEPAARVKNSPSKYELTTIAGHTAVVSDTHNTAAAGCSVTATIDEQTTLVEDSRSTAPKRTFQVVVVSAPTCPQARTAAATLIPGLEVTHQPAQGQPLPNQAPPSPSSPSSSSPSPSAASGAPGAATADMPVRLGDLDGVPDPITSGAAFDPCSVVSWADFPAAVRGPRSAPERRIPQSDDVFDHSCRYDNSILNGADPDHNEIFLVIIAVGHAPRWDANPTHYKGWQAKTWHGRHGVQRPDRDDNAHGCTAIVDLGHSRTGGVTVTNNRFPDVDPCDVVRALMNRIAATR